MCDNFLLTITANLHIDDPLNLGIQDTCMLIRLLLNMYSAFRSHCPEVKSVDIAVSIISLWHNTFPVQRCNNELIKINLSIFAMV